jgi:7-carboxy-7-deazaguanine synthase
MKVVEIFPSLQGEGQQMGLPTVFVRFSGCNLRCEWCDTKYAYDEGEEMDIGRIVEEIRESGIRRVCLTGGEPTLQEEIMDLIKALNGYDISIETNGSKDITPLLEFTDIMISLDIKCPSSGMSHSNILDNIDRLRPTDQLKFVIADEKDYEYAKDILKKHTPLFPVIFTPVGGTEGLDDLAETVLEDRLNVRVLPQLHKIIWPEEDRGK